MFIFAPDIRTPRKGESFRGVGRQDRLRIRPVQGPDKQHYPTPARVNPQALFAPLLDGEGKAQDMGKRYLCTSFKCNCGRPIGFFTKGGRIRPRHLKPKQ